MTEEFVLSLFEKVDRRDWEGLRSMFCDDVIYERPGYEPISGIDELVHFYSEVRIIAKGRHHLDHIAFGQDCGACWGRFVGESKQAEELDVRFADAYTFEDGRIKTRTSYFFRPAV